MTNWWRIGWIALITLNSLLLAMHVPGIWFYSETKDDQLIFIAFGFLHILCLLILLYPYRERAWWAWWATWAGIIPVATLAIYVEDPIARTLDATMALLMTVAQFVTCPLFRHSAGQGRTPAASDRT